MNILLDNTGFHHFGLCLDNKLITDKFTRDEIGEIIDDFLQICIQLVFYENIIISAIVPRFVKDTSEEIIKIIKKYNTNIFDSSLLHQQEENMEETLNDIANYFDVKIEKIIEQCKTVGKESNTNKITHLDEKTKKFLYNATKAISEKNREILDGFAEKSRKEKNDSSFFDIATRSIPNKGETVLDKILDFGRHGIKEWTVPMSIKLVEELRFISNQILSTPIMPYSPAVTRAKDYRKESYYIDIMKVFEKISKLSFSNYVIKSASFEEHLLVKGRGNIEKMLEETLRLREKFKPVRVLLKTYGIEKHNEVDYQLREKILGEVVNDITNDSGISGRPSDTVSQEFRPSSTNIILVNGNINGSELTSGNNGKQKKHGRVSIKDLENSRIAFTEVVNSIKDIRNMDRRGNAANDNYGILKANLARNIDK